MAERTPFIKATQDILGVDGVHWLVAYKPLQSSSAFRLWCKANGYKLEQYNDVAKNIDSYTNDKVWGSVIEQSKRFVGVIESCSPSPCSFLLLDKPISEEVGIFKVGDEYCANLDGYNCDVYKYLKNDYLSVTVWLVISEVCKLAGIEIPTIRQLNSMIDDQTYEMYSLGLTSTLNQVDSDYATSCVTRLKPTTVGEVSAFVASIRPGFASLLDNFLDRKPYSTGVKELDELLKDSYHYLMYQESIMKFLVWLGVEESKTYDIIKKISKKKFDVQELIELKQGLLDKWVQHIGTDQGFAESWQVVEDAAHYSFNASHSLSVGLDSLYGAYLKCKYPLEYYTVALNVFANNIPTTTTLSNELKHFGITLKKPLFGYSKADYFFDKELNVIYKGVGSIKYLNEEVSNNLYEVGKHNTFKDFYEVLQSISSVTSKQLKILIIIGYFRRFGKSEKLLNMYRYYNTFNKKTYKISNEYSSLISMFALNITDKTLSKVDNESLIRYLADNTSNKEIYEPFIVRTQVEFVGSADYTTSTFGNSAFCIIQLNTKYTPKAKLYRLYDGKTIDVKISVQAYNQNPVNLYDTIIVENVGVKPKSKIVNGKWTKTQEKEYYIDYTILESENNYDQIWK